jgi:hypothetical protein
MRTISWIGCTLSSGSGNSGSLGICPPTIPGAGQVDLLQAPTEVEMVALRRQPAIDRTGADGDQHLAVAAKLAQHMDVLGVADAALDQADVAGAAVLDVGQRRAVEFDALEQFETLVDVQQGHVTAKAAGQRSVARRSFPRFGAQRPSQASSSVAVGDARRSTCMPIGSTS